MIHPKGATPFALLALLLLGVPLLLTLQKLVLLLTRGDRSHQLLEELQNRARSITERFDAP